MREQQPEKQPEQQMETHVKRIERRPAGRWCTGASCPRPTGGRRAAALAGAVVASCLVAAACPAADRLPIDRRYTDDAVAEVQRYRDEVAKRNAVVASPEVARQLDEAAKLETRLQDAASGAAPMAPMEAKDLSARGYAEGRPGSRK